MNRDSKKLINKWHRRMLLKMNILILMHSPQIKIITMMKMIKERQLITIKIMQIITTIKTHTMDTIMKKEPTQQRMEQCIMDTTIMMVTGLILVGNTMTRTSIKDIMTTMGIGQTQVVKTMTILTRQTMLNQTHIYRRTILECRIKHMIRISTLVFMLDMTIMLSMMISKVL